MELLEQGLFCLQLCPITLYILEHYTLNKCLLNEHWIIAFKKETLCKFKVVINYTATSKMKAYVQSQDHLFPSAQNKLSKIALTNTISAISSQAREPKEKINDRTTSIKKIFP